MSASKDKRTLYLLILSPFLLLIYDTLVLRNLRFLEFNSPTLSYLDPSFTDALTEARHSMGLFVIIIFFLSLFIVLSRRKKHLIGKGWKNLIEIFSNDYSFSEYSVMNIASWIFAVFQSVVIAFLILCFAIYPWMILKWAIVVLVSPNCKISHLSYFGSIESGICPAGVFLPQFCWDLFTTSLMCLLVSTFAILFYRMSVETYSMIYNVSRDFSEYISRINR